VAQAGIALAATERIKIGLGINPAVARNPAFLAMEYATLAIAFPGRFIGGIGHGVAEWMDQIGAKPASWLKSIDEITSAVRRILRGERVTVAGDYVRLRDIQLEITPDPVPPVLLGVRGDKSVRLAGTCADGLLLSENSAPAYVGHARALMAEGRRDAGQNDPGLVVVYANCVVDDRNPEQAKAKARDITAAMNGAGVLAPVAHVDFAADLAEMIERGGAELLAESMPDAWLHELAITGTSVDALATIDRYAEAGADAVILVPPEDADWNAWLSAQNWATHRG
jgi:alkanesulfonate monooxygenase SsuD/methylene tetrahydromethanopterin reductase-like flavin-dependent oxidoreductase (luciferase family)